MSGSYDKRLDDKHWVAFMSDLTDLVNIHSIDSKLGRPDFMISRLIVDQLLAQELANMWFDEWRSEA